jgi:hypothetical protein
MKCLSMKEPWLSAVLRLGKTVENRSWAPSYRGRILLHASSTMEEAYYSEACAIMFGIDVCPPPRSELFFGGIVGAADIVDVIPKTATAAEARAVADRWGADVRWWMPVFRGKAQNGLILRNVTLLPRLVPYRGQMSLFEVPDDVLSAA